MLGGKRVITVRIGTAVLKNSKLAIAYTKGCLAIFKGKRQKGNKGKRSDFNFVFFK